MKTRLFTKQTTHLLAYTLLCALAITTVGCSKEEPNVPEGAVKRVTATAAMPEDGLETRVVYPNGNDPQWEQGDAFSVWKENTEISSTFTTNDTGNNATAQFEGDIACEEGDQLYAFYPKQALVGPGNQIFVDMSKQTIGSGGNLYHYMYAQSKLKSDGTVDFNFQHAVAILKITFTGTGTPHTVMLAADGLVTSAHMEFTPDGCTYSKGQTPSSIFVTGDFSNKSALVFLLPSVFVSNVRLAVKDVNGKGLIFNLKDRRRVEAGMVYTYRADFSPY